MVKAFRFGRFVLLITSSEREGKNRNATPQEICNSGRNDEPGAIGTIATPGARRWRAYLARTVTQ